MNEKSSKEEEGKAISFRDWKEVLAGAELSSETRRFMQQAIFGFSRFCRDKPAPASIALAKSYIEEQEEQAGKREDVLRNALRWFVRKGETRLPVGTISSNTPSSSLRTTGCPLPPESAPMARRPVERRAENAPKAATDLGGADWEPDLIRAMRERNFLFRTEATYREWAHKFAAFIQPRCPYAASGEDIGAFLSHLAVTQRAAPSTQRQALNALVFLVREPLKREPGDIPFHRPYPRARVPTVLSPQE